MRILAVGGGSGGHVTPIAAVCSELCKSHPNADIRVWCDTKFYKQAFTTMQTVQGTIKVEAIIAGKLRRYHKLSLIRQLFRFRTIVLPNIIDAGRLCIGFVQSVFKLIVWRPDVVFTKGGFVCLPVGIAAVLLRIPLVIHDSDAHPGLTSRILARWASKIATGAPLKYYPYPKDRSHYIGIPVASAAKPLSESGKRSQKKVVGFSEHEPLVVITGGGLGAASINDAVMKSLDELLSFTSVALIAGERNVETLKSQAGRRKNLKVYGYVPPSDMQRLLSVAEVVVSRAGATTLLELASLAKPAIIVPNKNLTGGHQVKNAEVYKQAKAVLIIEDRQLHEEAAILARTLDSLLLDAKTMKRLATNISTFAKPNATKDMVNLILGAIR